MVPDPIKRERRRDIIYNGTNASEFQTAVKMWISLFNDMEKTLNHHAWLAGNDYSIADCAYTPYLTRLEHLALLGFVKEKPLVAAWYKRIKARPSYKLGILNWLDEDYLSLMSEKGKATWPKIDSIIKGEI